MAPNRKRPPRVKKAQRAKAQSPTGRPLRPRGGPRLPTTSPERVWLLEQRKMDFLGALVPDIQKELLLRDRDDFPTVSTLNTLARYLWNKNRKANTHPDQPGAKTETAPKPTTDSRWGPSGTRKKPRRSAAAPADRKPPRTDHNGPKETNVICWGCNQPGHYRNECPKSKDTPKSSSANKPGEDSGRKT